LINYLFLLVLVFNNSRSDTPFERIIDQENIKTVLFYAYSQQSKFQERSLTPPIISIQSGSSLILEFDDMRANYRQFRARIIHCDEKWVKSNIMELEYLEGFNEFFINSFDVSQNTKIPYYHYRFKLPKLNFSGNYVLQIFEDELDGKLSIQERFMIFDAQVNINAQILPAQDPAIWRTHHQLNLTMDLGNFRLNNPRQELEVYVRQNFREDRILKLENKFLVNNGINGLKFNSFNNENTVKAGNEFRFFNASSAFAKGDNISKSTQGRIDELTLTPQNDRSNKSYLNAYDNDGAFIINSHDGDDLDINSDYMNVKIVLDQPKFSLETEIPVVIGKFNSWNTEEGKMDFNPNTQQYEKTFLLKQGVYDYAFAKLNTLTNIIDEDFFEGSFSETNNTYEVFIYYKPLAGRSTQLIGYRLVNMQKRN
jgi:hypothetical protein